MCPQINIIYRSKVVTKKIMIFALKKSQIFKILKIPNQMMINMWCPKIFIKMFLPFVFL